MLGAGSIRRDEGQVDLGFLGRGKLDLRLFCRFLQALQRQLIAAQVNALFLAEFISQIINDEPSFSWFIGLRLFIMVWSPNSYCITN